MGHDENVSPQDADRDLGCDDLRFARRHGADSLGREGKLARMGLMGG